MTKNMTIKNTKAERDASTMEARFEIVRAHCKGHTFTGPELYSFIKRFYRANWFGVENIAVDEESQCYIHLRKRATYTF